MLLEDIARTYGMCDYFDMNTGMTYHLSRVHYIGVIDETIVPVSELGNLIGFTTMKGDWSSGKDK